MTSSIPNVSAFLWIWIPERSEEKQPENRREDFGREQPRRNVDQLSGDDDRRLRRSRTAHEPCRRQHDDCRRVGNAGRIGRDSLACVRNHSLRMRRVRPAMAEPGQDSGEEQAAGHRNERRAGLDQKAGRQDAGCR